MNSIISSQEYKTAEAIVSAEIQHYMLSYLTDDPTHNILDYVRYALHRGPSFPESIQRAVPPKETLPLSKDRKVFLEDSLVSYFNNFHTHIPYEKTPRPSYVATVDEVVDSIPASKNASQRMFDALKKVGEIYKKTQDDFMTCAELLGIDPKPAIEINTLKVAGKNPNVLQWCEAVFPMYVALRMFGYTHRELT